MITVTVRTMCESHHHGHLNRRQLFLGSAAVGAALLASSVTGSVAASVPAEEVLPGLSILPRIAWGADLPPKGPLVAESPQFLLVHHTASSNSYASAATVIRNTYAWQTSPAKGWNDVCYNFFIGRDGDVWEGRAGSLTGPVRADATGGSQGFAQLVCMLGDFTSQQPTVAARASLAKMLAWMSTRYQIDISAGATTSFISRGSQRYAVGTSITAATISGHRDMSYTSCPGDAFYPVISQVRSAAIAQRDAWVTTIKPARRLGTVAP